MTKSQPASLLCQAFIAELRAKHHAEMEQALTIAAQDAELAGKAGLHYRDGVWTWQEPDIEPPAT